MVADSGESAGHLDEEDDADRAERDRPDELVAKARARLRRGRNRAGLQKAAHAGDDPKRDFEDLLEIHNAPLLPWAASRSVWARSRMTMMRCASCSRLDASGVLT